MTTLEDQPASALGTEPFGAAEREARIPTVVFVTPEEPAVMPVFFGRVLPSLGDHVAAVAVVSPVYKRSSWLRQAKKFVDAFGLRSLAVESAHYGYYKAADVLRRLTGVGEYHSVKSIARAHGVPVLTPADVNGSDFLAELRALEPDLVISVSCPQIFKSELLAIPPLGCVNVHSALLPEYRGVLPTFWALANGEQRSGVTVHFMVPGIDGGDIILQREIPISSDETLNSLMRKSKTVGADLVLEAIMRFANGPVPVSPNPSDAGSYFSFPERQDVKRFRAKGRRLR